MKSSEWECQFGNEIVCARKSFRLEINGMAIKTWELQYLVTIMIMTLAGGVNFTSGRRGGVWEVEGFGGGALAINRSCAGELAVASLFHPM